MRSLQIGCLLLCISITAAYTQTFERTSVDAGGASVQATGIELVYTLGEVHVTERTTGSTLLSEGFLPVSNPCLGGITQWSGVGWSNGLPDATKQIRFRENFDTGIENTDIEACRCEIDAGVTVIISSGRYALVQDQVIVQGTLLIEHQGSLVQVNRLAPVINNGLIQVGLTTPDLDDKDFMILGSPMTEEQRNDVFANAVAVGFHETANFVPNPEVAAQFPNAANFADDNGDFWNPHNSRIVPGEGYLVRPQSSFGGPGGIFDMEYDRGTLNNGDIRFDIQFNTTQNDSPNILANPYPSAIAADDFINENPMIDELYFWEHLTPPNTSLPGAGSMNFSMEDISLYNLMGGVAAASDPTGVDTAPNGMIATGQGFGVKATAGGAAYFRNTMRRTTGNTTLRKPMADLERIWLQVNSSDFKVNSSTLIGFSENTTAAWDAGYDSKRLATIVSLYSHLPDGSDALGIQSRESWREDHVVPLGFSTLVDTTARYTIGIADIQGVQLKEAEVYLFDYETGSTAHLNEEAYTFTSGPGTYDGRFRLQFEAPTILGSDPQSPQSIGCYPNPTSDILRVVSAAAPIVQLELYDLQGRKLKEWQPDPVLEYQIQLGGLNAATYLLVVEKETGKVTQRIVKR